MLVQRTKMMIILAAMALSTGAMAADFLVAGDYRMIEDYFIPLPPGATEGAIIMSVTADRPIELVGTNPDFVRQDSFTFNTAFTWNDSAPRMPGFYDDLGDTTYVVVEPRTPGGFDPAAHSVPVVSITTAPEGLWDPETGIYVEGNYVNFDQRGGDWEREARFRFYEPYLGLVVDEPVGLRIHGGFSRFYHQKGLRIYFDDYGSSDQVDYFFFHSDPISFRRLICRANRFDSVAINTNVAEGLMGDLGHAFSRHRLVAMYLNEEYWGAYNLRERLDDEFFEHTWSLAQKGDWNFIKDGDEEEGSAQGWWDFLASFGDVADPTDPAWFDVVRRTMDLASYIDWQLINFYLVPTDNGFTWNLALYQPGDHPWRFVMWDEDLIMDGEDLAADMFTFFTSEGPDEWAANQAPSDVRLWTPEQQEWLTMFRTLLGNQDFRSLFRSRYEYLMTNVLTPGALMDRLDEIVAEQTPEIPGQAARWEGFQEDWYAAYAERTRMWLADRHAYFQGHAEAFFSDWPSPGWPGNHAGLVINEVMPVNTRTITDESGDYDSWVELYNSSALPINLTGVQLYTLGTHQGSWEMPAVLIRPGEHKIVWLDGQEAEGALHAPQLLIGVADVIQLAAPAAAGGQILDERSYAGVPADQSYGRNLDGHPDWVIHDYPTPGEPNNGVIIHPGPIPDAVVLEDNYPNPFLQETNLVYGLPVPQRVAIRVFDARGRYLKTLVDDEMDGGFHPVNWDGTDTTGRPVASGVYYARLDAEGVSLTNAMTLIR